MVIVAANRDEKAQLQGDSYEARREEPEGPKALQKVRVVSGLNELEYHG